MADSKRPHRRKSFRMPNRSPPEKPNMLSDQIGISVLCRNDQSEVFHTYSCCWRGVDRLNGARHTVDLVPQGRDEDGLEFSMAWVRRHDQV
jgi:predicted dithiol-disulfide oxidoreductase (DUF899 family)